MDEFEEFILSHLDRVFTPWFWQVVLLFLWSSLDLRDSRQN